MNLELKPSATSVDGFTEIYNSNTAFLERHIGVRKVDANWCADELTQMSAGGFCRYDIIGDNGANMGFLECAFGQQTYLSLIILHSDFHNSGIGALAMDVFECLAKSKGAKSIRIDVVTDYADNSLGFWKRRNYIKDDEVTLSWGDRKIPAIKMVKPL